jgi:hypothetical protein
VTPNEIVTSFHTPILNPCLPIGKNAKKTPKKRSITSSKTHVRDILDYYLFPHLLVVAVESNFVVDTVEKAILLAQEGWGMWEVGR